MADCSPLLGHPYLSEGARQTQPHPIINLVPRRHGDDSQHADRICPGLFVDTRSSSREHNNPSLREDHIVRDCSPTRCTRGVLGVTQSYLGSLPQEIGINLVQSGRCDIILGPEAAIEPLERHAGFLLVFALPLGIKEGGEALLRRRYQLHVLVQATASPVLAAIEEGDVVLVVTDGDEDGPSCFEVLLVQRLVLLPVTIGSQEHKVGPGIAELVGCYEVGAADVVNLEPCGVEVASCSVLLVWFAIAPLRLWLGGMDGWLFGEGRGKDELKLERTALG